jgi:L-iditol 2-dehydrogenase
MFASTMDALVIHAPNTFSIEQVAVPLPRQCEALCRVRAVAICGTDAHIISGDFPGFWPPAMPFTPGHEWAGEIVALGPDAALFGWQVGDRVAGSSHAGCGYCRQCQLGHYQLCDSYGRSEVHSQYGHNKPGAYATYVVQSIKSLTPIPDGMSYDVASMCDTTSIAMHTVNRAGIRPGTNAAVLGAGVMGLLAAECARVVGAARVIVIGRGERLERAADLGWETVDCTAENPVAVVRARTGGLGVEVALECAGSAQTIRWAVDMLRKGGRCAAIGIPLEDVDLPIKKMVLDELEFVGARANTGEMADIVPLIADGRIRASELITHRFSLREFAKAYETFTSRLDAALKVIVYPDQA